jgi:DNA-binding transcriptional LysR family regulator
VIEAIETLETLRKYKTMGQTATALRITQSTVSKRIKSLEDMLERKLLVQQGRYVNLTTEALLFLKQVQPHVIGIKDAISSHQEIGHINVDFGFSESILSSWGCDLIQKMSKTNNDVSIIPHAHRGPVVADKIRSGQYLFGICPGDNKEAKDLMSIDLGSERMVLMGKSLEKGLPLMTVEPTSETWRSMASRAKNLDLIPDSYLEFFTPIAKLAKFGIVRGLVPLGVANEVKGNIKIKRTKLSRRLILLTRKTTYYRSDLRPFIDEVVDRSQKILKGLG